MKRITAVVLSLVFVAVVAHAAPQAGKAAPAAAAKKSVTGEVVDLGCYLGHGAKGADHVSCATKCLSRGMPVGILTSTGTLYLVTMDHDNGDPYASLKTMAAKTVTITGEVFTRNGLTAIEASAVKPAK